MRTIVLGRDGVINQRVINGVQNAAEWTALPGSLAAIARLNHAGYRVAVATNQPGVGSGILDLATLGAIHHKMYEQLARSGGHLDGIFFCPHSESAGCSCRIPRSGLLEDIAQRFGIDPVSLTVVGDTPEDVLAARTVAARPLYIAVATEGQQSQQHEPKNVPRYANLSAAVDRLIAEDTW